MEVTNTTMEIQNSQVVTDTPPPQVKCKSGYFHQYFNGSNRDKAEAMGDLFTFNQSEKIKAGNMLETHIYNDLSSQGLHTYQNIKLIDEDEDMKPCSSKATWGFLTQLKDLNLPCLIMKLSITKKLYEKNEQECYNKKANEIDFAYLSRDEESGLLNVDIFEVKNGCDFDTKKSKGEVQSLTATKNLFDLNDIHCKSINIVGYDAVNVSDINIKTDVGSVSIILYEDMVSMMGLNGPSSRERIDEVIQNLADNRLGIMEARMRAILEM